MILIKFKGGLGNQLFQFAYAKVLSWKNGQSLKFDLEFFKKNNIRRFMLRKFENDIEVDWQIIKDSDTFELLTDGHEQPTKKNIILDGYFQNPLLFLGYRERLVAYIRTELISDIKLEIDWFIKLFNNRTPVAIHLRRTDYLTPENKKIHGVCTDQYYKRAVKIINERVLNPHYFIFSDDPEYAEKLFSQFLSDFTNIASFPGQKDNSYNKDIADLLMMSCCSHFIIANSTFSWWAAYLCLVDDKLVIAPRKWYANPNMKETGDKIYDFNWLII